MIFQNEKTPFQAIKTRTINSRKIDIIPKGLTHGFGTKMAIFPTFIFQEIQARKTSFTIFQKKKKAFLRYKNKKFKNSKNWHFSKGVNPWLWSKQSHFSNFFFQTMYAWNMSFTIFQNQKTPFQAIKTKSLKSRKIDIILTGLTHGFGAKMAIFQPFIFQEI